MSAVPAVTMGPAPASPPGGPRMSTHPGRARVEVYDLTEELLLGGTVKGLTISGNAERIHLQRQAPLLEEFDRRGGRVLVNGRSFPPLPPRPPPVPALGHRAAADLVITPVTPPPSSRASTRPNSSTARASRAPPPARS